MIYDIKDVLNHFYSQGVNIRPKKVRRIVRNMYPEKSVHRWSLTSDQYNRCLEVISSKVRIQEVIHNEENTNRFR